jgi:hypothetical protein
VPAGGREAECNLRGKQGEKHPLLAVEGVKEDVMGEEHADMDFLDDVEVTCCKKWTSSLKNDMSIL